MKKPRHINVEIPEPGPERVHKPKVVRSHISQEFRERGQIDLANETISRLRPPFKAQATGVAGEYSYAAMPVIGPKRRNQIEGA